MTDPQQERFPEWFGGIMFGMGVGLALTMLFVTQSLERDMCRAEFRKATTAADSLHVLQDVKECRLP
jgi:hypothetical protein